MQEMVFFFHHVVQENEFRFPRCGSRCLYPLNYLPAPQKYTLKLLFPIKKPETLMCLGTVSTFKSKVEVQR